METLCNLVDLFSSYFCRGYAGCSGLNAGNVIVSWEAIEAFEHYRVHLNNHHRKESTGYIPARTGNIHGK